MSEALALNEEEMLVRAKPDLRMKMVMPQSPSGERDLRHAKCL